MLRLALVLPALVLGVGCFNSSVEVTGRYGGSCATHITFLDEAGEQIAVAPITPGDVMGGEGIHAGECGMWGTFEVTLPEREAYEAHVPGAQIPTNAVMTLEQLRAEGFEWYILAFKTAAPTP